ncbi:sugar porter family MFS transporter [Dysgonomonas sp. Marseille-P4361]|uniref:sugar porter family MFS transporter n=1 Tax=Dysgonomonas sp. Marseille-P4361 TaxID=2161820 RepID=UPI002100727D|nr:sugar porter family MFS transporter [Dysgonomonas sp. Marseille-P4361]
MDSTINMKYVTFLTLVAALGGFLFGYDVAVVSGTISQVSEQFDLDTLASGWYVGCALLGSIIGVLFAGVMCDRLGRKPTMSFVAILFILSAIGCAVSTDFNVLVIARIIGGMGIGVVSIASPLYISEISVPQHRGKLVALYQLAVTIGILGAYLVNFKLLEYSQNGAAEISIPLLRTIFYEEVWRSMLGMAAVPALFFLIVISFIPESPRWLVLKGKEEKANTILERLLGGETAANTELESIRLVAAGQKVNWRVVFEPGIRKAVLIGAAIAILGQFMGVNAVMYYGPTIFESAGLSSGDSLFYQVIVGLVNVLTTVLAVFIIDKIGRKKLVYIGVSGMILCLLLITFYFTQSESLGLPSEMLLVFFLSYVFFCAISISAVIFVFLSEMYPTKVRGIAMSIAGFSLWTGTFLIGQLTPWMLETLKPAGTFLLFAVMCIPYILIVWKLMPETTGKSLEEIEKFWTPSETSERIK